MHVAHLKWRRLHRRIAHCVILHANSTAPALGGPTASALLSATASTLVLCATSSTLLFCSTAGATCTARATASTFFLCATRTACATASTLVLCSTCTATTALVPVVLCCAAPFLARRFIRSAHLLKVGMIRTSRGGDGNFALDCVIYCQLGSEAQGGRNETRTSGTGRLREEFGCRTAVRNCPGRGEGCFHGAFLPGEGAVSHACTISHSKKTLTGSYTHLS